MNYTPTISFISAQADTIVWFGTKSTSTAFSELTRYNQTGTSYDLYQITGASLFSQYIYDNGTQYWYALADTQYSYLAEFTNISGISGLSVTEVTSNLDLTLDYTYNQLSALSFNVANDASNNLTIVVTNMTLDQICPQPEEGSSQEGSSQEGSSQEGSSQEGSSQESSSGDSSSSKTWPIILIVGAIALILIILLAAFIILLRRKVKSINNAITNVAALTHQSRNPLRTNIHSSEEVKSIDNERK